MGLALATTEHSRAHNEQSYHWENGKDLMVEAVVVLGISQDEPVSKPQDLPNRRPQGEPSRETGLQIARVSPVEDLGYMRKLPA
ncbi:hypothetical protein NDU88_008724 [Pleurodeles waltl]|uniref:Uncharacterized protein n=1 Tax=Pleurodeles waltl TaxID=8319 RepID=A0AAV7N988_PLEWA|nr:hypothetical protein NDU88_008724 [Pleurodeles waltl]